jgi:hypothetical protein
MATNIKGTTIASSYDRIVLVDDDGADIGSGTTTKNIEIQTSGGSSFGEATATAVHLSTDRVGIGTLSPERTLDVESTSTQLRLSYTSVYFCEMQVSSGGDLYFLDRAGTNNLTITDAGLVGIGTASPGGKLHITDTSNPDGEGTDAGSLIIDGRRDGAAKLLTLRCARASGSAMTSGGGGEIRFQGYDGSDYATMGSITCLADGQTVADGDAPSKLQFNTTPDTTGTPTTKMTILANGNVGIGVADPDDLLEIKGSDTDVALIINAATAANDAELKFRTGDANDWAIKVDGSATNDPLLFHDYSTGAAAMCLNNGKVGIGTNSPSQQFQVHKADDTSSDHYVAGFYNLEDNGSEPLHQHGVYISAGISSGATTELLRVDRSGTNCFIVKGNGNVGIGEDDPGYVLHVKGDVDDGGTLCTFEHTQASIVDNDNILRLGFVGDTDGDCSEGNFIKMYDTNTAEMGVIKALNATVVVDSYSDYRLKDDVTALSGGLDRVNNLRPVTFTYKTQKNKDNLHEGFIAHEVQEHIPYAVRGEKDAMQDDGSIKSQSFCIYQLIPQLVSAIQELSAKVTALENA